MLTWLLTGGRSRPYILRAANARIEECLIRRDPLASACYFRSWHRGTREMDLFLGRFAERYLAELSEAELGQYEALARGRRPGHL